MPLVKRSVSLHGHRTSVALEPEFWDIVDAATGPSKTSLAGLIANIDDQRDPEDGLASAIRVWALKQLLTRDNPDL